jgi:hypothetical protein
LLQNEKPLQKQCSIKALGRGLLLLLNYDYAACQLMLI